MENFRGGGRKRNDKDDSPRSEIMRYSCLRENSSFVVVLCWLSIEIESGETLFRRYAAVSIVGLLLTGWWDKFALPIMVQACVFEFQKMTSALWSSAGSFTDNRLLSPHVSIAIDDRLRYKSKRLPHSDNHLHKERRNSNTFRQDKKPKCHPLLPLRSQLQHNLRARRSMFSPTRQIVAPST